MEAPGRVALTADWDRTAILVFSTGGTERLRITSAGLVGIGTSSPGDVLHVKGGSTYAGIIADNSAATGGGAFRAYRNGVQKAIFCADSWVTGTSSDDAAIYADAGGGIKFYTNNSSTAKAVLTSGGSLGIGTTSPSTTLSIGASASSSYNGGVCLNRGPSAYNFYEASDGTNTVIFGLDNSLTVAKIGSVNSYPIGFFTGNSERARIDASRQALSWYVYSAGRPLSTGSRIGYRFVLPWLHFPTQRISKRIYWRRESTRCH
jgi:hypothetical protein